MPAFFVHGVPDSHLMWDPIRSHLSRKDIIAPDAPGFGSPIPAGFNATKEEYVDWLIAEIEKVGEPVDLVGHDWGSFWVQRITSIRPDLVRTMTAGAAAIDKDYVWHDVAKIWQTPTMGEQFMQGMTADAMKVALGAAGVPAEYLEESTALIDDAMKDSILKLYRSATNVGPEWAPDVDKIKKPVLLLWGKDDPYITFSFAEKLRDRLNGKLVAWDCGHWWPLERPAEAAAELESFWASV